MMLKSHIKYLTTVVNIAVNTSKMVNVVTAVNNVRCSKKPVYNLIKDIVCDIRFYSVTHPDVFWKRYGVHRIQQFIDGLCEDDWRDELRLTEKKEEFLNAWFLRFILPLSDEEQAELSEEMGIDGKNTGKLQGGSDQDGEEDIYTIDGFSANVCDCSKSNYGNIENLPPEMQDFAGSPMLSSGRGEAPGHDARAKYLDSISPELVSLAEEIGRTSRVQALAASGKFQHSSRSDISGVSVGNDLSSLLPNEVALLSSRDTEGVFYRRYVQKRLQVFSSRSDSSQQSRNSNGPIFMCIDTSGSMEGAAETMAKTLALAIAIIAQKKRRPLCVINYSHTVSFFVLQDLKRQKMRFLRFLSHSYSGGNNEDLLFRFLFKELPASNRYQCFKNDFINADLLVISDFEWQVLNHQTCELLDKARQRGMRFFGLLVDEFGHNKDSYSNIISLLDNRCLSDCKYVSGYDFFNSCDEHYTYTSGNCTKLKK